MFAKDERSSLPKELVNYVAKSFIALDVGLSFPNQNLYQQKKVWRPNFCLIDVWPDTSSPISVVLLAVSL